jgi:hypothetical protein
VAEPPDEALVGGATPAVADQDDLMLLWISGGAVADGLKKHKPVFPDRSTVN